MPRLALLSGRPRLGLALSAVLVLIVAGGGVALAMTGDSGPHYRLATVTKANVEQDLTSVGTVAAVNRATVAFPVTGTVQSVAVTVGAKVVAGQLLASLATGSLQQQVAAANAGVASARQTLAADEASETATASTDAETTDSAGTIRLDAVISPAARPSTSNGPSTSSAPSRSGGSIAALAAAVTRDQQQVVHAQQVLDADLKAAELALSQCRTDLSRPEPTPTPSNPSPTATETESPSATPSSSAPSGNSGSADCLAAIAQAPDSARSTTDQQARSQAEAALDKAIQALVAAANKAGSGQGGTNGSSGSTGTTGTRGGRGQTGTPSGTGGSNAESNGGSTGRSQDNRGSQSNQDSQGSSNSQGNQGGRADAGPASAQQLAADQAQIDAAVAELAVAEQGEDEAQLTSPLAGTVAEVGITAGRTVNSSASITVIGAGQEQVSTTVSLADVDSLKVGDQASVRVDGIPTALTGRVSSIGILNTGTGSTTSYPVTVLLDPTGAQLYDGSGAAVQIRTARVTDVLSVPSSAVHTIGDLHTVTVWNKGKTSVARITVGAVGSDRTQVLTGLAAGQQVVLADLAEPLPSTGS